EHVPGQAIAAHTKSNGVRVMPLAVSTPLGPLQGALTVPAGEGPFPAVVLVQGSGSSDMDETIGPNKPFSDIADGLAQAGIASLRYNKRGFVYAKQMAGNKAFSVDDEVTYDVLSALHLLAKQPSVDPQRLFVLGLSEGGLLVPRIMQRDPQLAGGIMLAAPARPLLQVAAEQVRDQGAKSGMSKTQIDKQLKAIADQRVLLDKADPQHPPAGKFGGVQQSWWLSLHDYHQLEVAKSLRRPLLLLQGDSDFQVSPSKDFEVWKRALADKSNATFHLYPGLGHLFSRAGKTGTVADYLEQRPTTPKVIADIGAWIKAQARL
ncbi:MAG: lysophospholipase, partial [Xanthomonadales bacterium]|nr:lysophospholipase [Xanthomonadales bacterium]